MKMDNLTQETLFIYMDNYSKPVLPDNPIRYVEEHNDRIVTLMLMMTPLCIMSSLLSIYGLIILFCKMSDIVYNICSKKTRELYVQGNLNVKKVVKTVLGEYF